MIMSNIPTQQNNPGDVKSGGHIASFSNPAEGKAALYNDLTAKMTGTSSTGVGPNSSLYDFAKVYAPASDKNNPAQYAANLANQLGISPDTPIGTLKNRIDDFANAVSKNEGYSPEDLPGVGALGSQVANQISQQYPQQTLPTPATPPVPVGSAGQSLGTPDPSKNPLQAATNFTNALGLGGTTDAFGGDIAHNFIDKNVEQPSAEQNIGAALQTASIASPFSAPEGLLGSLGMGALLGASQGAGQAMTQNESAGKVAQQGLIGGAIGAPFGGAGFGLSKILNPSSESLLESSIQKTMPLQDKATRVDTLRNTLPSSAPGKGGAVRTGILGKSTPVANAQDIARGTTADPFVRGSSDPLAHIGNVNQAIINESNATNDFLDSKTAPSHFKDMIDYLETNRPTNSLQKDPGAEDSYNRATQDAIDTLYKTMKNSAKVSGDFGPQTSGTPIRQARIAIDQQISDELGKNTFGTPQYKGIKAAEIDIRNLLNRMNEDMLRYPGQLENLNKMNNFISQAKERGIDIDLTNPQTKSQLESSFNLNPTGDADAQKLATQHEKMDQLYDARDNLIDRYQNSLGKNRVQEAVASNPWAKGAVDMTKKAIPFGLGNHF